MQKHFILFLIIFSSACSKPPEATKLTNVNPQAVQTILQTDSPAQQRECENEIKKFGGRVLYRNELGVLMTDKRSTALPLTKCTARITDNHPATHSQSLKSTRPDRKLTPSDIKTLLALLPAQEMGARDFVTKNPTYDGRGVKIAILDTGVELKHPMLEKTSTGKDKVLAFEDFSGEGNVELVSVTGDGTTFQGSDGKTYQFKTTEKNISFGVFEGSSLQYASELSQADTFKDIGVIVYATAQGLRGRVDSDGDGNFDNEIELFDFAKSRTFTRIGEQKSLTVSMNIADDRKNVSLCFDDGAHGTHVSGIATGYDPNGFSGVAPGAQIVLGKIGDNRLSGGSTTTASMMLGLDFAVQEKAQIINMSYGQNPGSNVGRSAIEQYVDTVALKKGILFSISAGNEGPGLQTVGVPAGAEFAIVNGAYLSKATAHLNYNFVGVAENNIWFFSSIGPRQDGGGGVKLLAPGTAVSSVPGWSGGYANYRGTSMASPEVTGALALILSGALQEKLLTDRSSITQAVFASADPVPELKVIEQGHGLINIPQAFEKLKTIPSPPTDYQISVNSPSSPDGTGAGIFVRARTLPDDAYTVNVTPNLPQNPNRIVPVTIAKLVASAPWIHVDDKLWLQAQSRSFLVFLDSNAVKKPGLYSEKISAFDISSGGWLFDVPVTIVTPALLNDDNSHNLTFNDSIKVGHTTRHFVDVPAGTTAVTLELSSDGPPVWAQWLDPMGRTVKTLQDAETTSPLPILKTRASVQPPGVYELDLVAPTTNVKTVQSTFKIKAYSLDLTATRETDSNFHFNIQNNFEPIQVLAKTEISSAHKHSVVKLQGSGGSVAIAFTDEDKQVYSRINFKIVTANTIYDLMTDYPYRIFDSKKNLLSAAGLTPNFSIRVPESGTSLSDLPGGPWSLEIEGAFALGAPNEWEVDLSETRTLVKPALIDEDRLTLATGQVRTIAVDTAGIKFTPTADLKRCVTLSLSEIDGKLIQDFPRCE